MLYPLPQSSRRPKSKMMRKRYSEACTCFQTKGKSVRFQPNDWFPTLPLRMNQKRRRSHNPQHIGILRDGTIHSDNAVRCSRCEPTWSLQYEARAHDIPRHVRCLPLHRARGMIAPINSCGQIGIGARLPTLMMLLS